MSMNQPIATTVAAPKRPMTARFFQLFEGVGVLALLVIVVVIASLIAPGFFTYANIVNTIIAASITAITAFGMTFAIAMGGFDLSVGSVQAVTAIAVSSFIAFLPPPIAIIAAIAVGYLIGTLNGLLITQLRIPAFVATFGMMSIVRGIALLVTNGQSVMVVGHQGFAMLNNGKLLGIPIPFIIVVIVFVLLFALLRQTPFGRHVCAIGGNRAAAVASGIMVNRVTLLVFGLVGATAAVSGVMLSAQLLIVDGTLGTGFELQTIAISVLGGTSLAGGSGNLLGTLFASLLLATISSALNILKVEAFYQYLYVGVLLIFALYIDTVRRDMIARSLTKEA